MEINIDQVFALLGKKEVQINALNLANENLKNELEDLKKQVKDLLDSQQARQESQKLSSALTVPKKK